MKPIFPESFLAKYLSDFTLSQVTNIRVSLKNLKGYAKELESGKISSMKEEEIKSRFINLLFGDVLGFNYGNSEQWMLREEKKSSIDGTKPDAVLGYCYPNKKEDDIRALIEIKSLATDLDARQARQSNQTTIDQAFNYVAKMGGSCKWVIVSNLNEVRFYSSLDRSAYQRYLMEELTDENKLKELLFLFHKDRFIKQKELSSTDRLFEKSKSDSIEPNDPVHIVDQIFYSLKRFEGFGFVDPNYIASIPPFNILTKYVWHFHQTTLLTLNPEVYDLIKGITIADKKILIDQHLQQQMEVLHVVDAEFKLKWIFNFLNHCYVKSISAVKDYKQVEAKNKNTIGFGIRTLSHFEEDKEGITKGIDIQDYQMKCNCCQCLYRRFEFDALISQLKSAFGDEQFNTFEYGYGNYLIASNNFKSAYTIYKAIEREAKGKENRSVQYFLAKQNQLLMHNLISGCYYLKDREEILEDILAIDMNHVIYDEIEYQVDPVVRKYLVKVKEDEFIFKMQDEIDELIIDVQKLKVLYDGGRRRYAGPNHIQLLQHKFIMLYLYVSANRIIYDCFKRYQNMTEKVFGAMIMSYQTPDVGLKHFDDFFLMEAILHIFPGTLKKLLEDVHELPASEDCVVKMADRLYNCTKGYYDVGFFNVPVRKDILNEQLSNYRFKENYTNHLSNLFTILTRLNIRKEQFTDAKNSLINYLLVEDELGWTDLEELSFLILKKGDLFDVQDLTQVLTIAVNGDRYDGNKYTDLIKKIPESIRRFYPEHKISSEKLVRTALLHSSSDRTESADYSHLINLTKICDDNCQAIMIEAFKRQLDKQFNSDLYESLLITGLLDADCKNYFRLNVEYILSTRGNQTFSYTIREETNFTFLSFIRVLYNADIPLDREELKSFVHLSDIETWLLNPFTFDYKKFDAQWLTRIRLSVLFEKIQHIPDIQQAIDAELLNNFTSSLAEIKYKYFRGQASG